MFDQMFDVIQHFADQNGVQTRKCLVIKQCFEQGLISRLDKS